MLKKRLLSTLLAVVLLCSLTAVAIPASAVSVPDGWAANGINEANGKGLLTGDAARDFKKAMTREEYCAVIVTMVEKTLGKTLPVPALNPFNDTNSVFVQKAANYGVTEKLVSGVGGGRFNPDSAIIRQDYIYLLIKALRQLELDTGKTYLSPAAVATPFKDTGSIDAYARDGVLVAFASGIVSGDQNGYFFPKDSIECQGGIIAVLNGYNKIQLIVDATLTPEQLVEKTITNLNIGYVYGDSADGVSGNLILPSKGANGVLVSWSSSNPALISGAGIVAAPVTSSDTSYNVTLTATAVYGGISRTKTFALKTTSLTGDKLLVENASGLLSIYYTNAKDTPESVTARVALPDKILGLDVTWISDTPAVISNNGTVTVPQDGRAVPVKLTAQIVSGGFYKSREFNLTVRNPVYTNTAISLHGVKLGMTTAQVSAVLGSYRSIIQTGATSTVESWQTYYDTDYSNYIAVAFQNSLVVGIYSQATNAENTLRNTDTNTSLTFAQAVALGVSGKQFTDSIGGNTVYALYIYSPTSTLNSYRDQSSAGVERLLAELINAYRSNRNLPPLEYNTLLANAARAHSTEMSAYNYYSHTSKNGDNFKERAAKQGYDINAVVTETIQAGQYSAIEFLDSWIGFQTDRESILSSNTKNIGVGFAPGISSSQYRTYCTAVYGTTISPPAQSVTIGDSNKQYLVAIGGTLQLSATAIPVNGSYGNPEISWRSSDPDVTVSKNGLVTVQAGYPRQSFTITAYAPSGSTSGPVNVADAVTVYPLGLTFSPEDQLRFNLNNQVQQSITITPTLSQNPLGTLAFSYVSNNTNIVKVEPSTGNTALVTAVSAGTATITCSAKLSGYNGAVSVNIPVSVTGQSAYASDIIITGNNTVTIGGTALTLTATTVPSTVTNNTISWAWTSSDGGSVTITPNTGTSPSSVTVTGVTVGHVSIIAQVQKGSGFIGNTIAIEVKPLTALPS